MRALAAALAFLLLAPLAPLAIAADAPPPLPEQPAVEYYVGENGQQVGPLTLEQVQQRIRDGKTRRDDYVWKSGLAAWAKAEAFAELMPTFQAAVPPPMPADANFKQMMVGTWEGSSQMQGFLLTSRLTYSADGRFSGYAIMTAPGSQPMQAPLVGTWTIEPVAADSFTLTLTETAGGMSITTFRVIDDNTLEDLGSGSRSRKIAD